MKKCVTQWGGMALSKMTSRPHLVRWSTPLREYCRLFSNDPCPWEAFTWDVSPLSILSSSFEYFLTQGHSWWNYTQANSVENPTLEFPHDLLRDLKTDEFPTVTMCCSQLSLSSKCTLWSISLPPLMYNISSSYLNCWDRGGLFIICPIKEERRQ